MNIFRTYSLKALKGRRMSAQGERSEPWDNRQSYVNQGERSEPWGKTMIKRYAILLLAVVCSFAVQAQTSRVSMSGTVTDAANGESMMGVYVILTDLANPSNVQGGVTNQAGYYSVSVLPGRYKLSVNYLGYKPVEDTIVLNKSVTRHFELSPAVIEGEEVVIQGERGDVNVTSGDVGRMELDIQTIKALPALMGEADIIKSIQLLPGVQSGGEGNSGFYVRGSGTDQNLILLDEATIYNPDHLFGFFSIFNADAVKSIELIKSGMPAYFGGRAASILNIYQKEGNLKKFEVDGGLGLIFSHLTVQGPIKKNRCSFLISARRTYADLLIQPFLKKDSPMKGTNFYFYDINAKFNVIINPRHRLYFGAYYGSDVYGFKSKSQQTKMSFLWSNAAASARWNWLIANQLFLNTSATFSYYDFGTEMRIDPTRSNSPRACATTASRASSPGFPPRSTMSASASTMCCTTVCPANSTCRQAKATTSRCRPSNTISAMNWPFTPMTNGTSTLAGGSTSVCVTLTSSTSANSNAPCLTTSDMLSTPSSTSPERLSRSTTASNLVWRCAS